MPSGRAHAAISATAALALFAIANNQPRAVQLALAGGCVAGILITPDLDVDEPVRSHYVVRREFGLLPAILWRLAWLPYGKLIAHRSWVSHIPVVGTTIRAVYLLLVIGLVMAGLHYYGVISSKLQIQLPAWLPYFLVGLGVSDLLHWAADVSWSGIKNRIRRLKSDVRKHLKARFDS